jgi:LysR family transcriptional regulator, carnitine catabolism transcriptional activator
MIDISSRTLRAMIALDDLRNFSLAAERCFVTPSALSQMLRKLESDVGLQLVDRDRRHVTLTTEGLRFVSMARRVMGELSEVELDLKEHASARRGRVGIAALVSVAAYWLPDLIADYRTRFPGVEVNLFDVAPPRALELVRTRQADFAITSEGPGRSGVEARLLFKEQFLLACHIGHPLARKERVKLADLEGCSYIRFIRSGSMAQYLEPTVRGAKMVDSGFEVDQMVTAAGLVASGAGIAIVPETTVPYFCTERVAMIPLAAKDLSRPMYLVQASGKQLSRASQEFINILAQSDFAKSRSKPS